MIVANGKVATGQTGTELGLSCHRVRELERPVLHQLGVEAPIRPEVDVFEEDSPHASVDARARLAGKNGHAGLGLEAAGKTQ